MTPEEVFERLRDVHTPEVSGTAITLIDPRPLIVFPAIVLVVIAARHFRRRWRLSRSLAAVDRSLSPHEQRDQIMRVVRGIPSRRRAFPVPESAYLPAAQITTVEVEQLRRWAKARFG